MFAQTFFIVWRESLEALLVIGILDAWLKHETAGHRSVGHLWGGVLAGLAAAVALSFALVRFGAALPPESQEAFQAVLIFTACALILHVVFWMRAHGHALKGTLERKLTANLHGGRLWGITIIALIAVMREGAETVIFLQGIAAAAGDNIGEIAAGAASALVAAALTYALLQLGGRYLSWRWFFRLTEAMLLLLACALLVTATGHLVSFGLLPYSQPLWDTSALLDDMTRLGGIVADLTGYRAMPDAVTVTTWVLYWSGVALAMRLQRPHLRSEAAHAA